MTGDIGVRRNAEGKGASHVLVIDGPIIGAGVLDTRVRADRTTAVDRAGLVAVLNRRDVRSNTDASHAE